MKGAVPPVIPAVKLPLLNPLQVMFDDAVMAAVPPGVLPITAEPVITQPLLSVTVKLYVPEINPIVVEPEPPPPVHAYV